MATFQARIEDYTGTISDTSALTTWLTAGGKLIVDLLPDHVFDEYATAVFCTTAGLSMSSYRIQKAFKNGYDAVRVDSGMLSAVQDENSIHYALNNSPVSVVYNGKIYIYPNGGNVLAITYPTSILYSESTVSGFPTRMLQGLVLYTAIQVMLGKSSTSLYEVDAVSLPTAPSAPVFSFVDVTGQTVTLPSAPTFTAGSAVTTTAPTSADYTAPSSNVSFTNLETYISTDVDLTKAEEEARQQALKLDELQKNLFDKLNTFNADLEEYKGSLQIALENARMAHNIEITGQEGDLSVETQTHSAGVQKAMEDARLAREADSVTKLKDLEATIAEYQSSLSKYQSEVQAYSSQMSANINLTQGYLMMVDKLRIEFNEFINITIRSYG